MGVKFQGKKRCITLNGPKWVVIDLKRLTAIDTDLNVMFDRRLACKDGR